tara:strand:+ start:200 stop:661 length:462 start_codon:yes stop_codon:yes gene_type:complete
MTSRWISVNLGKWLLTLGAIALSPVVAHGGEDYTWSVKVKNRETSVIKSFRIKAGTTKIQTNIPGMSCQVSRNSQAGDYTTRWLRCKSEEESVVRALTYASCGPNKTDSRSLIFEKSYYNQERCEQDSTDDIDFDNCLPTLIDSGITIQLSCF